MKYLPLVWAALRRKPVRTILTLLSVVVAFGLFGLMQGVTAGLDDAIETYTDETRLMTQSRVNLVEPLPISYLAQIQAIRGIDRIAYYGWFGGYFQEPRNQINTGAVNIEAFLDIYPEFVVTPEALDTMLRTRTGALVGRDLLNRFGWSVGDRVPLGSSIWTQQDGSSTWDFDIVGAIDSSDEALPADDFLINYDYFDEERSFGKGAVAIYMSKIADPSRSAQIAEQIDDLFLNSTAETKTQNEREWTQGQIAQIGDINFFVNAIAGAVMFTLLFLTWNTMAQSVRERIPELTVLKTYGYSNVQVVTFVFAEALLLCVGAALIGLGLAAAAFPGMFRAMGIGALPMPTSVVLFGCAVAALLAFLSGLLPALRAQRLSIVDALAGR